MNLFFYRQYFDDIFVLFSSLHHAEKFKKHLSSKHSKINFPLEKENDNRLFFRQHYFAWKQKNFTNAYQKKTFSGVYTNLNSFIPEIYITGLIKSMLFWCFSLCSDFGKFHHEINTLKHILYKNSYPHDLVAKCIK